MNRSLLLLTAVFAFSALPACASSADEGTEAEASSDESDLSTNRNADYYIVTRQDMRRCISPVCGGVFVKRVNQAKTRCADGTLQNDCYVGSFDYPRTTLSEDEIATFGQKFSAGKGLVRATLRSTRFNGTTLGKLSVVEAWEGASEATPDGTFYRVADNGIRCIQAPCPSTTAYTLNSTTQNQGWSAILDGTNPQASQAEIDAGSSAMATREGVLVAGGVAYPRCAPNTRCGGPIVIASEFYLRVKHVEAGRACGGRAGNTCSPSQFCAFSLAATCGWADAQGTCQARPQICTRDFRPVCGCDGKTYSNECTANAAGTAIVSAGACAAPQ